MDQKFNGEAIRSLKHRFLKHKVLILGLTLALVPCSAIIYGSYIIYKTLKRKKDVSR